MQNRDVAASRDCSGYPVLAGGDAGVAGGRYRGNRNATSHKSLHASGKTDKSEKQDQLQ